MRKQFWQNIEVLIVCVGSMAAAPAQSLENRVASQSQDRERAHRAWEKSLVSIVERATRAREQVWQEVALRGHFKPEEMPALPPGAERSLADLQEWARRPPTSFPNDWLYERHQWTVTYQGLLLWRQNISSPAAARRREALEVALWLAHSPFLGIHAPHLSTLTVDGLLSSASNDLTQTSSRARLLWAAAEVYAAQGQWLDEERSLRATMAVADGLSLNLADGARYKLAARLKEREREIEATELLKTIRHDALKRGAQVLLREWSGKQ